MGVPVYGHHGALAGGPPVIKRRRDQWGEHRRHETHPLGKETMAGMYHGDVAMVWQRKGGGTMVFCVGGDAPVDDSSSSKLLRLKEEGREVRQSLI
jgi:hypothetical protein